MRQIARVIALHPDGTAELAVKRDTACGDCASCGGCAAGTVRVTVENSLHAAIGDAVTIETATSAVLAIASLVYLLPLMLFFAGYALGSAISAHPFLIGGFGFAVSLLAVFIINRKLSGRLKCRMIGFAVPK